jgi:hypothetical protein
MPLSIPAFVQYQAPMPPLRGLWNASPSEGDRFVNAEIDWLTSPPGNAVQFQLAGSSPVALSQVVAVAVDNAASGADARFIFPDSGYVLSVPARTSGVFPVFTNALMFYVSAPSAILGDRTVFQAFNSMPPPVPVPASAAQNTAQVVGLPLANGSTQLVPLGVSGTLNTISVSLNLSATAGNVQLALYDGSGKQIWAGFYVAGAAPSNTPIQLTGLSLRFTNGLTLGVSNLTTTGGIDVNVYYSQP